MIKIQIIKSVLRIGILNLDKYAQLFGLADKTGIDIGSEKNGIIPTPEWKKKAKNEIWFLGNTYHFWSQFTAGVIFTLEKRQRFQK